ncbi:hypothetical protein JIX56_04295 [Streptomyces sp. CA-210063]|uniref:hypothetical protein n=1 Tax=Streptomyces sp. CA-210063 TaxID=2801029 RepID=UPI00214C62A6|nr:hypothetical protein [Streptomyces sp. CA-210063]UUU29179.1 hypothetical protein JIX56_04295 [Streptomyces sp. CA-210063]
MKASEISPTERIRILADILSGRLTAGDAALRNGVPVRVVQQWLRDIPVAAPTDRPARAAGDTAPSRAARRPLPRCRVVVDEMVQGLGL